MSIASSAEASSITLAYEDKTQPPYYFGDTDQVPDVNPGVAIEMIKLLEQRIDGLEVELVRMPWKRALLSLKSDRVDGVFKASYKKERLKYGWYPTTNFKHEGPIDKSRRMTIMSYSLYQLKESLFSWQGEWQDLKGKIVGAPLGYSIVESLQKQGIHVEESMNTDSNLRMLMARRFDLVALQTVTADGKLIEHKNIKKYAGIEKLKPPLTSKPYYLMLSNGFVQAHPILAQRIWDELKLVREKHLISLLNSAKNANLSIRPPYN